MRITGLCAKALNRGKSLLSVRLRLAILMFAALFATFSLSGAILFPNPLFTLDASGVLGTYGAIDVTNPFFQRLGTNGRTCNTCHIASSGWTITPTDVHAKFNATAGLEPIFRTNDGSNCPSADVSTPQARKQAYSLLLNKALLRISIAVPMNAEFQIIGIQDPYNCPETTTSNPAFYRRPLPSTNVKFLSAVMWDGRESVSGAIPGKSLNLSQSLANQAQDATTGHAQGSAPTAEQLEKIVAFETGLSTAQMIDQESGSLTAEGATGGPINLSQQTTYIGVNDALGGDPTGAPFNPSVFTLYDSWKGSNSPHRQSVARGETLFNSFPIPITDVAGLNDALKQPVIMGTCSTCHDTPNAGNHSLSVPLAIGTTAYPTRPALDIAGLPVYEVQCIATGVITQVTDIGRAMISGKCSDIGKMKGPILRGLAARAPYFHNGSAATLAEVVEFYDQRFNLRLTVQQKADLIAFLRTL